MGHRIFLKKILIQTIVSLLLLLASCGKEEFSARKTQSTSATDSITSKTIKGCSKYTLIKPKVDYLFLWDNSSSQFWVNSDTKAALRNTIELIAYDRFDYHILLAPLIDTTNIYNRLITENPNGLTGTAIPMIIPQSNATLALDNFPTGTGAERGMERAISLINSNRANGIFRQNAYTIIVLMSNGDVQLQTDAGFYDGVATANHITTKLGQLRGLRGSLNSEQFRFLSLVAHSNQGRCSGFKVGSAYKTVSRGLYIDAGSPYSSGIQDSYDICQTEFSHLFDGINSSIHEVVQKHVYNYWPFADSVNASFNKNNIVVKKKSSEGVFTVIPQKTSSMNYGFEYAGYLYNQATRTFPTSGDREKKTGHMIKLHGKSVVTYPDCLIVTTSSPIDYYGYVHLDSKPFVDSIRLYINGKEIPKSTTNGWDYIGYKQSQNIKIKGPANYTPGTPANNKTGYFLKLYGNAIYSNNTKIEALYNPSGG